MTPTPEGRPTFAPDTIQSYVHDLYGLDGETKPLPAEWDQNSLLETVGSDQFVIKIANRDEDTRVLEFQNAALHTLAKSWSSARCPRVVTSKADQDICSIRSHDGTTYWMRILTFLEGQPLATLITRDEQLLDHLGFVLGELDQCLESFQHPAMDREIRWDLRRAEWISAHTGRISNLKHRGIVERILLQYRARVSPLVPELPVSVIHNDANDENILVIEDKREGWRVAGLLDFGDMLRTNTVNELAIACAYAIFGSNDPLAVIATVAKGYHRARPLSETEIEVLFPLICMRLCLSVTMSAIAAHEDPSNDYRRISEDQALVTLERLEPIDWIEADNHLRTACGLNKRPHQQYGNRESQPDALFLERGKLIGPSLSLAYQIPLEIVRGQGQFLFEPDGRAYLDCINNVCHVGHCHPGVVAALSDQAAVLNTNTRYLHPYLVEYAERLTATLPEPLSVCYFVNSGSEANELAVRMARSHTGRHDVIVLEDGYHGNTQTLVDLSPYKSEGPGGAGLPDWVHKVIKPDPYRGPYRGQSDKIGKAYAGSVRETCERLDETGHPPALFLCESILGCGGQIVLPEGYLQEAFHHVHSVGGVCIVDEVQVGMGRVGDHMWAFETQNVIPDIVTMGKPIGNGHPLGAVVTTPEIAQSFDNGMEYFNTFGGNPVSMAVGLAVLDVLEEEQLLERASRVGGYLANGFRRLAENHPIIGDVRGLGMFLGVELVNDRKTLDPATEKTAWLIERVKADGILLSAEGPLHNVLKIKPPLQFEETDADLLLASVDRALSELCDQ
ncbi:MAG: aminotransferase class III-fold pyridoxal phosphate-dependent enzyme [Fidelibacterota bacterium]|nr:MAG: aminotransferase class III-fold pyridoxal phosphate-dependent enzyme [Candidatus Neomarinimicrobiota bacterium]